MNDSPRVRLCTRHRLGAVLLGIGLIALAVEQRSDGLVVSAPVGTAEMMTSLGQFATQPMVSVIAGAALIVVGLVMLGRDRMDLRRTIAALTPGRNRDDR